MMGQLPAGQNALFYEFIEKHVPPDHLLRQIDTFLDLNHLREHLTDFYSTTGRPSIDPELMIRMLIVGYCFGIRSERRVCEEVHLNLAYRWFCRLGLEDEVPDHSTFSKNRHGRFRDSEAFRVVFEDVVARCMAEGLIQGEGFAIDASTIKADASKQRGLPGSEAKNWPDPANVTRPVREYLAALDNEVVAGTVPKSVSLTDPQARWTAVPGGPAFFAYSTNYLIDTAHGVILDVETTPAYRTAEVDITKTLLERVEQRLDIKPDKLIGVTPYGAAPMLGWLVDKKSIAPHVPVWDKSQRRDGTFSNGDFEWDRDADQYRCPAGKSLHPRQKHCKKRPSRVTKDNTIIYATRKADCSDCALKERCSPNDSVRKIRRSVFEDARNAARRIAKAEAYRQSRCERKKVEMLFAHLKRILRFDRLRLRGLSGANDEFLLAATAQNLRKLAKLREYGPPIRRIGAPA